MSVGYARGRARYVTPELVPLLVRILERHVNGERGDKTRPLAKAVLRDLDRARFRARRAG